MLKTLFTTSLLLFFILLAELPLAQGEMSEDLKRLSELHQKSSKLGLNFYASNGEKSFIMRSNSFKAVPNIFFKKEDSALIPPNTEFPSPKAFKKLIDITRLKGFEIYVKNGQNLFMLTEQNTLIKIRPDEWGKYFAKALAEEQQQQQAPKDQVAEEKSAEEKKKEQLEARKTAFKEKFGNSLFPGWHRGNFHGAIKSIGVSGSSQYTNYLSFAPYFKLARFPLSFMPEVGGNFVTSTEKMFLAADLLVNLVAYVPAGLYHLAGHIGLGRQIWLGMNENNTMYQLGVGVWFRPLFFYFHEANISYGKVLRTGNKPDITEIKLTIGAKFFD